MLAVVIPTLNEVDTLPALLRDLHAFEVPNHIVVADGGSQDGTVDVARAAGATIVTSEPGRAKQMNSGASRCESDWLLFIHADARLPVAARRDLCNSILQPNELQAAAWRLRIASSRWVFRVIELGARIRDRVCGLPYGDQALLIRRQLFDSVGGFRELPVMEDVAMVRAIRPLAAIHRFPSNVVVSSRRWDRHGPIRSSLRNLMLLSAYSFGVSPQRLMGFYPPESG